MRRGRLGAAIAGVTLLAACAAANIPTRDETLAPPRASDLAELAWISPDVDRVAAITQRPRECLASPASPELRSQISHGRIAFESPALLGGAAARGGLSCSSCHVNGRGNPNFFINGVSGAPGTADVTSSLFSKTRGDGQFNPVPIPDLVLRDGTQMKDRTTPEFRAKIRGLIVEEFDGQEPPVEVLDDLIAYMDALRPEACASRQAKVLPPSMQDFVAASMASWIGDNRTRPADVRIFYMRAARLRLERMDERLTDPRDADLRADLRRFSQGMANSIDFIRTGVRSPSWNPVDLEFSNTRIEEAEARSLYNPDVLRRALEQEK
jgi:hypothetical protein